MLGGDSFAAVARAFTRLPAGFVAAIRGERPVFEMYPEPVAQDLSVASFEAAGLPTPSNAWLGNGTDVVGSEDLTATGTMLEDQPARGLWDGSSIDGYGAMEANGSSGGMDAAASTFLDIDKDTSFAVLLVARMPSGLYGALASKRSGGTGQGWRVLSDSNGSLTITYALTGGSVTTASITGTDDGRWQFILAGHNATTDVAYCYNDKDEKSASTSALTGTAENTAKFSLFDGDTSTKPCVQIASAYVFTGTDAETLLTNRSLLRSAWWTHGTDSTGKLTTYTRTGSQYTRGKDDATGYTLLPWGTGATAQTAIGYDNDGTGGWGLAANSDAPTTNLNPYSEPDAANWSSDGTPTMAYLDRNNALGYKRAAKITATALNDLRKRTFTATAAQRYVASCVVEWDGTGSAPELVVYNATDGTVASTANSVHTGTPARQRLYLVWTPTVSETQNYGISPTEYGVGASGYCWFDHMQYEAINSGFNAPGPFVATRGVSATTDLTTYRSHGFFSVDAAAFRAEIVSSLYSTSGNRQIIKLRTNDATSSNNERLIILNSALKASLYLYSSAAALLGIVGPTSAAAPSSAAATYKLQIEGSSQAVTVDGSTATGTLVPTAGQVITTMSSAARALLHSVKIFKKSKL